MFKQLFVAFLIATSCLCGCTTQSSSVEVFSSDELTSYKKIKAVSAINKKLNESYPGDSLENVSQYDISFSGTIDNQVAEFNAIFKNDAGDTYTAPAKAILVWNSNDSEFDVSKLDVYENSSVKQDALHIDSADSSDLVDASSIDLSQMVQKDSYSVYVESSLHVDVSFEGEGAILVQLVDENGEYQNLLETSEAGSYSVNGEGNGNYSLILFTSGDVSYSWSYTAN
jgi:hypothetical protein